VREFPLSQVFRLLEPGPVVLVTTSDGVARDVMTMSWHMVADFVPPTIAFVMSGANFSRSLLEKGRSCVVAIPGADLAETCVRAGAVSGRDADKFALLPLTPLPAEKVSAPLIAEALANLECVVVDDRSLAEYEIVILRVVKAWENPDRAERRTLHSRGSGHFFASGREIDLSALFPKEKEPEA
jgi:flavin reductase (DIM6/NTAB) family NADH-FMN oxidoreductase RutF